jgi:hypothetical protein
MELENGDKTAFDLLSDGFRGDPPIFRTLKLGETKIPLNRDECKILEEAIHNKDYYEIKSLLSKLKKPGI